jgi:hypothetical protein
MLEMPTLETAHAGRERERAHLHFRKFRKVRSVFYFRKLNKITKGGLKIQEFTWRYKI